MKVKKLIARRIIKNWGVSSRQERKVTLLQAGVKIGIAYNATESADRSTMEKFREKLVSQGLQVEILGFVNAKQLPSNLSYKPGMDYFGRKDLNWTGLPAYSVLNNFAQQQFDYFIAATASEEVVIFSFAVKTKAKFRLGPYFPKFTSCFDFMIDLKGKKDLKNYLDLTEHYLKALK